MIQRKSFSYVLFIVFFTFQISIAGTVTGRVTDANTNDFLPGANVLIQGTNYGAATDRAGEFSIPNIPSGDYTLSVQYIGYTDHTQDITVSEDKRDNHFEISLPDSTNQYRITLREPAEVTKPNAPSDQIYLEFTGYQSLSNEAN